ncbi:MAG: fused MFS/spermidine synthase [Acidimicrobiales bacterium]
MPDASPPRAPLGRISAAVLVTGTSAAVLVLEILAGRLLAPYIGVTLQTYTGIIGTVLAGIAAGTWLGGWAADRHDPAALLGPALVAGGGLALLTVPLVRALGPAWSGGGASAVVVLASAGFLAPAVALSAVTPLVVKLQLRHLGETGAVVGRLSALGTVGAIAGTFLAGFVLIEVAPTSRLIPAIGVLLVVTGAAVWFRLARPTPRLAAGVLAVLALPAVTAAAVSDPCQVETRYYCARVEVDVDRPSARVLVLDDLRHSYVDLDDPTHLEFRYIAAFAAATDAHWPDGRPLHALHVGGGGFTLPRWLQATRSGSTSTVLELDQGVVDLAVDRLGLVLSDTLQAEVGDARLGVARRPEASVDLVVGDAFGGVAVPWHLATQEFTADIHRVLRPGGLYVANMIDRGPMGFARAETATVASVFEHVAVVGTEAAQRGISGNLVLVASDAPLRLEALAEELAGTDQRVLAGDDLQRWIADAAVLTDDLAPVDQLVTAAR